MLRTSLFALLLATACSSSTGSGTNGTGDGGPNGTSGAGQAGGSNNGGATSGGGGTNGGAGTNVGGANGGTTGGGGTNAGGANGGTNAGGVQGTGGTVAGAGGSAPADAQVPPAPTDLACKLPFGSADVSSPTTVVGQGTHVCDQAALSAAVAKGGVITFDCGGPTTIQLTAQLSPPKGKDTTIDGGGTVTLDGGGTTRILGFKGGGYRTTSTVITLQNLAFQNGHATGTKLATEPSPCSQGYDTDAGGGAVYVQDAVVHVLNCTFTNNSGQTPGPDVAGGGVYVDGSLGTTIIGSNFSNNTASNGGAVGSLNSDLAIYTTVMAKNTATGTGGNNTSANCTSTSTEIGDGGSGGAVYMDGGHDGDTVFCGDVFSKNHGNALGGAVFRVFDTATAVHNLDLDVSTMDGNVADGPVGRDGDGPGGGALYVHAANVKFNNSTISNNSSPGCGAIQADTSNLAFTNMTLDGNTATAGVGGAICIFSNGGTLTNVTFANNQALGGSSFSNFYGAALFGGNLTVNNTVFANNTTANSMSGRMQCAGGAPETGAHDVQWPQKATSGGDDSPCVTGIDVGDPGAGTLGDNGGSTFTVPLSGASSIIQVGTNCPATDQTGKARANPCTVGALEK